MKRAIIIWSLLLIFPIGLWANPDTLQADQDVRIHPLYYFTIGSTNNNPTLQRYDELLSHLKDKKEKYNGDDIRFLKNLFSYIHRKQLANYQNFVSLEATLDKYKVYDCLTGTALYALLLNDLGYEINIKEFDYHILLIVKGLDQDILIESTDPLEGFVADESEIKERLDEIISKQENEEKSIFSGGIVNDVGITELAGLQYYNQALDFMNNGDLENSLKRIKLARSLYPSKRIEQVYETISQLSYYDEMTASR